MTNYWRLKAAVLTRQLAMQQLQAEAEKVQAAYAAAMLAEGMEAGKNYQFNDADETAVEVTQVESESNDGA